MIVTVNFNLKTKLWELNNNRGVVIGDMKDVTPPRNKFS